MSLTGEFDQSLPEAGRALIASARTFALDVVEPALREKSGWAGDEIRAACSLGLGGIEVPKDLGGSGLPYSVRMRIAEEVAQVDFGFSFALINHHGVAARISTHGSQEAKDFFIPALLRGEVIGCTAMSEDGVGSDFGAVATTGRRVADGWILSGGKRWIGNAAGANVLLTFAQTGEPGERAGIACFIVDGRREGFVRNVPEPFSVFAAGGVGSFGLAEYRVPAAHVLHPPGEGFLLAMAGVNKARVHIAAMACGMIAASLDEALRFTRSRQAFGRPVIENQGLQWSLGDVATSLEALRLLTYRAARLIDTDPDAATLACAMAKKVAAETAPRAIAACVQALGARGISDGTRSMRHFKSCPVAGIADGTTQMMNERIGAIVVKAAGEQLDHVSATEPGAFEAIVLERDAEKKTRAALRKVRTDHLSERAVTVKVDYSTLNYKDGLAITGRGPVVRNFPMVPGIDFAGTVQESQDERYAAGDPVVLTGFGVGELHWGGLSQLARVDGDWLVPLPEGLSARQAMSIGTAGFTAMLCVKALERAGVTPEAGPVIVTGANGGVGTIAIALLAKRGYHVIASTGRPAESDYLKALGASEIIDRAELSQPGKPLGKERWAAAVDCVGSHTLANVCAGTRYGGVVAACGLAQGMEFAATVAPFILRGVSLLGIDSVYAPRAPRLEAWNQLAIDLPTTMIADNTTEIGLSEVIPFASDLLDGKVRGRLLVDVNR
jgi:acrylyl-CoA reductase (NADPH)